MKVSLNLASRPFGRNRMFYAAAALLGAALAIAAVVMVTAFVRTYRRSPELARQETEYRRQLSDLARKQAELEGVLRRPENSAVLERSIFLNELLYRKGISWTRTFADLEKLMPPRVRLISIRPQVTPDNEVSLDMQVGTETREAFVEFLIGIESSELFRSAVLHGDSPPTENQPLFRFRVSVIYEQKL
jgi:type IV pilus assembly protein PilN